MKAFNLDMFDVLEMVLGPGWKVLKQIISKKPPAVEKKIEAATGEEKDHAPLTSLLDTDERAFVFIVLPKLGVSTGKIIVKFLGYLKARGEEGSHKHFAARRMLMIRCAKDVFTRPDDVVKELFRLAKFGTSRGLTSDFESSDQDKAIMELMLEDGARRGLLSDSNSEAISFYYHFIAEKLDDPEIKECFRKIDKHFDSLAERTENWVARRRRKREEAIQASNWFVRTFWYSSRKK